MDTVVERNPETSTNEIVNKNDDNDGIESDNSVVENQQIRKSKVGMKYDLHTDI